MIKKNVLLKPAPFFFLLFFTVLSFSAAGGIVFSDPDLSSDNRLLLRIGIAAQDSLFMTTLPEPGRASPVMGEPPLRLLSAFPEKMDLLENGRVLQIRNAFGAMRISLSGGGLPVTVPGLPSFIAGGAASGRTEEICSSADGRWLLYLDPTSPALGNLVMLDITTGVKTLIASRLERPGTFFPASWSADSRFFIYERGGKLFYYIVGSQLMPLDEKLRYLGEGKVNSVTWSRGGDFYYLRNSTLYRVRGAELFARTLYADFLEVGLAVGTIPFEFDPCFDHFWMAPDERSILVSRGRRSLFYFPLDAAAAETVLPYLMLPRSCSGVNVLWPANGTITALVSIPVNGGTRVSAWRLSGNRQTFEPLPPAGVGAFPSGSLSPDGRLALFWGPDGITLYDYANWKPIETVSERPGVFCLWANNDEFIAGDDHTVERIQLRGNVSARRDLLCLSRANQFGFEENSSRILAKNGDTWFVTDGRNPWTVIASPRLKSPSQVSSHYRVFVEAQGPGIYENLLMIRNLSSVGTFPLVPAPSPPRFPDMPRVGKAALCFDLYDDDRGLPETLDALNRFDLKATFFLNGEFIRRHPQAAAEITAAGHEAASMFFALIDLSDVRYRADTEFITRGLARNEDEFYRATGKELSLFWHPPWYIVSPQLADAAAKAGYATVQRDVDPMDWVSLEDEKRLNLPQRSPSETIDLILKNVKHGSVIPVRLGLLSGGKNDYLFNRLNVLLDALTREGYTLTTISGLIDPR